MESDSKKVRNSKENDDRDRLTVLPDGILLLILSFLPTLDAVRTCSLRKFGTLWTMIPSLDFEDREVLYTKELLTEYEEKDEIGRDVLNKGFTSYVRNVLLFHNRATIENFNLEINELDWLSNNSRRNREVLDEIKGWIRYAIQKEVQKMNLRFVCCRIDADSVLPRSFFMSQSLIELKLTGVRISRLRRVLLTALKSLSLTDVEVTNGLFTKLLFGCPSLKVLDVENQFVLEHLFFNTPSVDELYLDANPCYVDCPNVKILHLFLLGRESIPVMVDVSSLREVNVYSLDYANQINEVVKVFYNVEVFKICTSVLRPFQLMDPYLPKTEWKKLHIESHLHNMEELLSIYRFLKLSPVLEELELYKKPCHHDKDCYWLDLEMPPPFVMPRLKNVTLRGYSVNCQGMLHVIEFLLGAASVDKIVVVPNQRVLEAVDEVQFAKKVSGFFRTSPATMVVLESKTAE